MSFSVSVLFNFDSTIYQSLVYGMAMRILDKMVNLLAISEYNTMTLLTVGENSLSLKDCHLQGTCDSSTFLLMFVFFVVIKTAVSRIIIYSSQLEGTSPFSTSFLFLT